MHSAFQVHLLNEDDLRRAQALAAAFSSFLDTLEELSGEGGREMSIVRTKLEEASFFAKKAMASLPENQK